MASAPAHIFYDPRLTADDFNEKLQQVVNDLELGGVQIIVRARAHFLTIEFGNAASDMLWVPYPSLLSAIGEVGRRGGN